MTLAVTKIARARNNGIVVPILAWRAARKAGIDYAVACALLEQESAGGANVYGSDPTIFVGHGNVTECNYQAYAKERDRTGQAQGVGPVQLTSPGYQRQADDIGGCWNPSSNMAVGFGVIKALLDAGRTLRESFVAYNGSTAYADQVMAKVARWREILR